MDVLVEHESDLTRKVDSLASRKRRLQQNLIQKQRSVAKLEKEYQAMEEQATSDQEREKKLMAERDARKQHISALKVSIAEKEAVVEELRKDVRFKKAKIAVPRAELGQLQALHETLKRERNW